MTKLRKVTITLAIALLALAENPNKASAFTECPSYFYYTSGVCEWDCHYGASSPQEHHAWYSCMVRGTPGENGCYNFVWEFDCRDLYW
jgi:hypothetical protein